MNNSKNGFTLAEVLVTLAIIGVVAALTIPSLMQNTNSTKYTTALKKNISVLNSALKTNIANNDMDASDKNITTSTKLAAWFVTGNANGIAGTTTPTNLNVLRWVAADASNVWLNDGTKLTFQQMGLVASGCIKDMADAFTLSANSTCFVMVDTNGDKKPNTLATNATTGASDIWILGINPDSVVPVITDGTPVNATVKDMNGVLSIIPLSPGNRASYAALTGAT